MKTTSPSEYEPCSKTCEFRLEEAGYFFFAFLEHFPIVTISLVTKLSFCAVYAFAHEEVTHMLQSIAGLLSPRGLGHLECSGPVKPSADG